MLKKPASFVLGSSKSSTYPRGYASSFDSPAALLTAFLSILMFLIQLHHYQNANDALYKVEVFRSL
jgi:hypothetical protein